MLLEIDDNKRISEIQDKFNECFPYLQVRFYPHKWQKGAKEYQGERLVGDIRKKHESGILEVKSFYKVNKIETDLKQFFGLNAKIFRIHMDNWIPTSLSEDLSLQEQINLAQLSIKKDSEIIYPEDYDEEII